MNRRLSLLADRYTFSDTQVYTFNVNIVDPITALHVEVRATNGASGNQANVIADCVKSVDIIDGGKVLTSLNGYELAGLYWQRQHQIPYQLISEIPSNVQNELVAIQFGRYWGDQQYAFDPTRYTNPQVRVNINLAAIRAVGATAFATGTATVTLIADVMTGASRPVACLYAREIYSYTNPASGITYIDLPVDWPYTHLLVRPYYAGYNDFTIVSHIKLTADNDSYIPFDLRFSDFSRLCTAKVGPLVYKHYFYAKNTDTVYPILKQDEVLAGTGTTNDSVFNTSNQGYGSEALSVYVAGSASASQQNEPMIVNGWNPFGCSLFEFGEVADPSTWLVAPNFKHLQLQLTNGTASATTAVAIEQAVGY